MQSKTPTPNPGATEPASSVAATATRLGLLDRLTARTIDPSTGRTHPSLLDRVADKLQSAGFIALATLAVQIALNAYGIPVPIRLELPTKPMAESTTDGTRETQSFHVEQPAPLPTPTLLFPENSIARLPATDTPPPDFSAAFPKSRPKRERPGERLWGAIDQLIPNRHE